MKRIFLLGVMLLQLLFCQAQILFAPPGAKWSVLKRPGLVPPQEKDVRWNEKVDFTGTVPGSTIAVLQHTFFFSHCDNATYTTQIKQLGDTVFFKNALTGTTWQTLFNFAAQKGSGWITALTYGNYGQQPVSYNYSVTVDSLGTITQNNKTLKRLFVSYQCTSPTTGFGRQGVITELYGGSENPFFYDDNSSGWCDGPSIESVLCYEDPQFGQAQFDPRPCDYSNPLGLDETHVQKHFVIYPNPCNGVVTMFVNESLPTEVFLLSAEGRLLEKFQVQPGENTLPLSGFAPGVYFLELRRPMPVTEKLILR